MQPTEQDFENVALDAAKSQGWDFPFGLMGGEGSLARACVKAGHAMAAPGATSANEGADAATLEVLKLITPLKVILNEQGTFAALTYGGGTGLMSSLDGQPVMRPAQAKAIATALNAAASASVTSPQNAAVGHDAPATSVNEGADELAKRRDEAVEAGFVPCFVRPAGDHSGWCLVAENDRVQDSEHQAMDFASFSDEEIARFAAACLNAPALSAAPASVTSPQDAAVGHDAPAIIQEPDAVKAFAEYLRTSGQVDIAYYIAPSTWEAMTPNGRADLLAALIALTSERDPFAAPASPATAGASHA